MKYCVEQYMFYALLFFLKSIYRAYCLVGSKLKLYSLFKSLGTIGSITIELPASVT